MSSGAVLTVVAVVLAVVTVVLFRLRSTLDSAELAMRRLAADVRASRRDLARAAELAEAVERDTEAARAALGRLEALKRRER